jgi:outer membrane protein assembly factor BamB
MPLGVGDPMGDAGGGRRISEEASMTRVLGVLMLSAPLLLGVPPAADATITPANVGRLALKWDFRGGTMTGGPAFANGAVIVGAWDGDVHALDPHTGVERWRAATGVSIQGAVLPLPDGRICFGDALARVSCIDAEDGSLLWRTQIGDPSVDNIWSAPAMDLANNRIYVGIASHTDNPCTKGQLVALNLETGAQLWSLQTVPDKVCARDTGTSCSSPSDCSGNSPCVDAVGAGVTASPLLDPTGTYVYMNTVGCFTFPSVGDSDSMFKVEAATGNVVWKKRVNQPEQFGFCEDDTSVECGSDATCSATVGGECRQRCVTQPTVECRSDADCPGAGNSCRGIKSNYHDFGFLNGPLLIEAAHGNPACPTNTLVVSGSKNGTLYAFCETTGEIVWSRAVQPTPISPGFAGFGLFNGAIAYADGLIFAALNNLIPARVCDNDHGKECATDSACSGGACLPEPEHLMAFHATNGATAWSDEIGRSWGHVRVENGVVYAGTGTFFGGARELYAYDAGNGTRLGTFPLPLASASRPLVGDNAVYVGYGLLGGGGIRAFSLCGNGELDDGEQCDDAGADDCCQPDCTFALAGAACSDGAFCTAQDTCNAGGTCNAGVANPCAGTACPVCREDLDQCVDETDTPCSTTTTTAVPLCRNAADCDDGNPCTSDACDPATGCTRTPAAGQCSDGDDCTADTCVAGVCIGDIDTPDGVTCAYDQLATIECDGEALPKKLKKAITKKVKRSRKLFDKATKASVSGKQEKATALLGKAATQLDAILTQVDKAVASPKPSKDISEDCGNRLRSLVQTRQQAVGGYVF